MGAKTWCAHVRGSREPGERRESFETAPLLYSDLPRRKMDFVALDSFLITFLILTQVKVDPKKPA